MGIRPGACPLFATAGISNVLGMRRIPITMGNEMDASPDGSSLCTGFCNAGSAERVFCVGEETSASHPKLTLATVISCYVMWCSRGWDPS